MDLLVSQKKNSGTNEKGQPLYKWYLAPKTPYLESVAWEWMSMIRIQRPEENAKKCILMLELSM